MNPAFLDALLALERPTISFSREDVVAARFMVSGCIDAPEVVPAGYHRSEQLDPDDARSPWFPMDVQLHREGP